MKGDCPPGTARVEPGKGKRSLEATERHPGEADRAGQERGRSLPDRLRKGEGAYRPGFEAGGGGETQIELGTVRNIGVGRFRFGLRDGR